jgi:flavin reductase (DIM6/NTAB) family NADH-FMN oxidoreductase RutF
MSMSQQDTHNNDARNYRQALSCFATGVTVVSTHWQHSDWGMTCNSFASVSLEPRLVLWSIQNKASSLEAFTQSSGFTVSVLTHVQQDVAKQFATGPMPERFFQAPVERNSSGRLYVSDALAHFDCSLHKVIPAGDHYIVIGQVNDFQWTEAPALTYWRSRFGQFDFAAA